MTPVFDPQIGGYLRESFKRNLGAHAYIVVGEKQHLPDLLKECAYVALCRNRVGADTCESCAKIAENAHQDVISIPADTAKNRLTVADVGYLVEESFKRPVDNSPCRVFLVNACNSVAGVGCEIWQNKLLKTLEEPMDGVYIFIGVTDAEGLLPTVRSRCQTLKQSKLTVAEVKRRLADQGFDERSCEMASAMSGGSVNAGELLLRNPAVFRAYEAALDTAENMTSTKNALRYASAAFDCRDCINDFLGFYTLLLRESVVYRINPSLRLLPSFTVNIDKICSNYTINGAIACIERINAAKRRLDDGANLSVTVDLLLNNLLQIRYLCRAE